MNHDTFLVSHSKMLRLKTENTRLREVLLKIALWELPNVEGKSDEREDAEPMSYGAAYGSNGERDYIRQLAYTALAPTLKQPTKEKLSPKTLKLHNPSF